MQLLHILIFHYPLLYIYTYQAVILQFSESIWFKKNLHKYYLCSLYDGPWLQLYVVFQPTKCAGFRSRDSLDCLVVDYVWRSHTIYSPSEYSGLKDCISYTNVIYLYHRVPVLWHYYIYTCICIGVCVGVYRKLIFTN